MPCHQPGMNIGLARVNFGERDEPFDGRRERFRVLADDGEHFSDGAAWRMRAAALGIP